tara:strand:+ start:103937 stop:104569 length:633 start_codon:yes stop_codon:yes gene_type:complete
VATFLGENIECVRGERLVLHGAGFRVQSGDVLVLTGPNGAGKSTLLRLMAGLMRPVGGRIAWADVDTFEDIADDSGAHNQRVVYVGHADAVKPALSVRENISFWAEINGGGGLNPDAALMALGISHLADLPARYLSAGQRRRVALTRMLTTKAPLWLLDEPTTALDSAAAAMLADLIKNHRAHDGMVVTSTHTDLGLDNVQSLDLSRVAA